MKETLRKLVYAATFLLLVGHGGGGNCDDVVNNVAKIPRAVQGDPSRCLGGSRSFVATGTCFEGPMSETWTCDKTTLTLPDGTRIDGQRDVGVGIYETSRGTCWISLDDYLLVCAGEAGACESPLVNPPAPPRDAGIDASEEEPADAGADADGGD
jgi:hypothetical protein